MASCLSCGSDLKGQFCSMCGAKSEDAAPVRGRQPAVPGGLRPALRTAALLLLGAGLFAAGMIAERWRDPSPLLTAAAGTGAETALNSPYSPDLADLPPVAAAEWYLDKGTEYLELGNRSAAADNFRKAVSQFGKALEEEPDNLYAKTYLGLTYFYAGESEQAKATEHEVLDRDPNYLWAVFNLAWMEEATGRRDQAILLYHKYLDVVAAERENREKYAGQYDLIDRQVEEARLVVESFPGGIGQ